jgi:dTDP-4-dehydrorhamnose 3,5-epimerase
MNVVALAIPDVKMVRTERIGDRRGFFSEIYTRRAFAQAGIDVEFVQENHSLSADVGVVRGLHFQAPPAAQAKLVRVVRGRIWDVALDIRRDSPSYGRHVAFELSAADWNQAYIPIGFAHGFATLEPASEIVYKVSDYYAPEHERGIAWDDPALGIEWPIAAAAAILSDKDRRYGPLAALPEYFR